MLYTTTDNPTSELEEMDSYIARCRIGEINTSRGGGSNLKERIGNTPLLRLEHMIADLKDVQVLAKAEWTNGEANPRFIVTSLKRREC